MKNKEACIENMDKAKILKRLIRNSKELLLPSSASTSCAKCVKASFGNKSTCLIEYISEPLTNALYILYFRYFIPQV